MGTWPNLQRFEECLQQVQVGWDLARLRTPAGEPGFMQDGRWIYDFDRGLGCVRSSSYPFRIKAGLVVEIEHDSGHMFVE